MLGIQQSRIPLLYPPQRIIFHTSARVGKQHRLGEGTKGCTCFLNSLQPVLLISGPTSPPFSEGLGAIKSWTLKDLVGTNEADSWFLPPPGFVFLRSSNLLQSSIYFLALKFLGLLYLFLSSTLLHVY